MYCSPFICCHCSSRRQHRLPSRYACHPALATGEIQQKQWLRVALKRISRRSRVGYCGSFSGCRTTLIFSDVTSLGDFISLISRWQSQWLYLSKSSCRQHLVACFNYCGSSLTQRYLCSMLASIVDISGMWIISRWSMPSWVLVNSTTLKSLLPWCYFAGASGIAALLHPHLSKVKHMKKNTCSQRNHRMGQLHDY